MDASNNMVHVRGLFKDLSIEAGLRGILGVTRYEQVYNSLMPVQRRRLEEITGRRHKEFMEKGFFVSFAFAYPDGIIDNIGLTKDGVFDKEAWNIYAKWYEYLNNALNKTSKKLAGAVNGIPLPATTEGLAATIESVKDYFLTTVSHRVHAEHSGIGWRGRNSLMVNPVYGCMIRLAAVITSEPVHTTPRQETGCGTCDSCLQVCTFLKHMDRLDDYRQQCLNYMNWLDLYEEVCGKCIKACVYSPRMIKPVKPESDPALDALFYTFPN